jgi:hypothetical protein
MYSTLAYASQSTYLGISLGGYAMAFAIRTTRRTLTGWPKRGLPFGVAPVDFPALSSLQEAAMRLFLSPFRSVPINNVGNRNEIFQ